MLSEVEFPSALFSPSPGWRWFGTWDSAVVMCWLRFLDFCHHVLMASFHLRRKKLDVPESYFHFPLFSPLSSGQDVRLARPAPPLAKSCSFPVLVPRKARETNIFFFHLHNENVYCGRHVVQQASSRWGNLSPLRKQLLHENAYSFFSISKKKIWKIWKIWRTPIPKERVENTS